MALFHGKLATRDRQGSWGFLSHKSCVFCVVLLRNPMTIYSLCAPFLLLFGNKCYWSAEEGGSLPPWSRKSHGVLISVKGSLYAARFLNWYFLHPSITFGEKGIVGSLDRKVWFGRWFTSILLIVWGHASEWCQCGWQNEDKSKANVGVLESWRVPSFVFRPCKFACFEFLFPKC